MDNGSFSPQILARALALGVFAFCSALAIAAVEPPPLPAGSAQAKIYTGQSPLEQQRMLRAHKHHHSGHYKKDITRDDTMDADPSFKKPR